MNHLLPLRVLAMMFVALGAFGAAAPADSIGRRLSADQEIDDRERAAIGARISFVREEDGHRRAFIVSASGKDAVRLPSSKDHSYPAGVVAQNGSPIVLEVGDNDEALTSKGEVLAAAPMIRNPAVSANGERMVFESSEKSFRDLFLVRRTHDKSQVERTRIQITNNAEGNYEPSFFPDNRTIAFTSSRDGQAEIYRMDVDDGPKAATRLTFSAGDDLAPRVSPDGERIAFVSGRTGEDRIWVMGPNGEAPRLVDQQAPKTTAEREHAWSPDGRFLVFASRPFKGNARILRWDVAADAITALTDGASISDMPKVSPDGRYIAFVSVDDSKRPDPDVWLMRRDGTGKARLNHANANGKSERNWLPTWVP
jgi:TolB protein